MLCIIDAWMWASGRKPVKRKRNSRILPRTDLNSIPQETGSMILGDNLKPNGNYAL